MDLAAELHHLGSRPLSSRPHTLCKNDIDRLMGGDEEAVEAIVEGYVLLHEMPSAIRADGPVEQRVAWVREKLAAWRAEGWNGLTIDVKLGKGVA